MRFAEVSEFSLPAMKVGTFEGLLSLSDDLIRADAYCEGVVRKCERQIADSQVASAAAAAPSSAAAAASTGLPPAGAPNLLLAVHGVLVAEFVRRWGWDVEAWDPRDPLPELLKRLLGAAERADGELRSYAAAYADKRGALTALERRRDGNLLVRALEDVITPAALAAARAEMVGAGLSEYVATYVVVLPAAAEADFLAGYESLAADAVPYGPEGRRDAVRGSPVVPGSARRLAADREGFVLYSLAALSKYADALRAALKERKYTLRDFAYAPEAAGAGARAIAALDVETAAALAHLREQAQRKFGEAVALWMHVKAIRLFVDSVLRYGLPAGHGSAAAAQRCPFAAVLVSLTRGKQRAVLEAARTAWLSIGSAASRAALEDAYGAASDKSGASRRRAGDTKGAARGGGGRRSRLGVGSGGGALSPPLPR